jgi:anti-anti-sigma factor
MSTSIPSTLLAVRRHGSLTVVGFPGYNSLNEFNIDAVGQELSRLTEGDSSSHLVLDLTGICFVTSTVLGKFVSLNRQARSTGGRLALTNLTPIVREALAVTRLDQLLDVKEGPTESDFPV